MCDFDELRACDGPDDTVSAWRVATLLRYTPARHPNTSAENLAAMRSPFYQANFCAECGNSLAPRTGFKPRHFCDDCARRLKQRRFVTPLAGLLFLSSLAVFAFSYRKSRSPVQSSNLPAPAVLARDSIVNPTSKPQTEAIPRVLCGARTRRGTPCRHRVQPGQRCAQHRGMPSMHDSASEFPPSAGQTKSRKH